MAKKRFRIKDRSGNVVDYDVAASSVTLNDGVDVEQKIADIDEEVTDLSETRYRKPVNGVPRTDLDNDVNSSLDKADSAIQGLIVNNEEVVPDSTTKKVRINIPTQVQSDWNESSQSSPAFIKNKPTVVSNVFYEPSTGKIWVSTGSRVTELIDINTFFNSISYNSSNNIISFLNKRGVVVATLDASSFVVDKFVENVTLDSSTNELVITFNTASGKSPIRVPLGSISGQGTVQSVKMNGGTPIQPVNGVIDLGTVITEHQSLSSYATKSELSGKQDRLTGNDVLATINSTQVHYGDSVNIEGQKGDKGEKGDTGDCELRQGDDVVSIIKNDFSGGTGYIASAELAKTLNDKSIGKGTYGQAWAHSQLSGQLFPWIWDETISGDAVLKPIWHIGNGRFIDAVGAEITIDGIAASTPTFSQGGGEVIGGTQVTIIPSAGALLYVAINSSSPTVSETAQKITINQASMVIDAWCATYGGESAHVTNTYTAAAPSVPTFNPSTDGAATRNMALTVTPANGCELHYKVNDGSVQTSQGALSTTILAEDYIYKIEAWSYDASTQMQSTHVTKNYTIARPNVPTMPDSGTVERGASITIGRNNASGSIKYKVGSATTLTVDGDTATVQLTAQQSTIEAWVELNGETSEHVTKNYTMAALNPPVFSPSGGEVLEGGQVTISAAQGTTIYYTTDGSEPTNASTSYAEPITINAAMTIKAIASDTYGTSAVTTASYTIKEDALIIDTTDQATEVTITYKTGGTSSNMTTASKTFQLNSSVHPVIDGETDTTSYRNTIVYGKDFAQEVDGTNVDMDSDKLITSLTFTSKTTTKRVDTGGGALFEPYATFSDFSNMVYADVKVLNTKTMSGSSYNVGNLKYIFRRIGGSKDANNPVKLKIRGMANGVSGQLYANNYTGSHYVDIDISELQPSDQENGCFNNFYYVCAGAYSTYTIGGNFSLRQGIDISSAMFNSDEAKTTKITIKSATPPDISANSDVTGGLNWLERIVSAHQDAGTTLTIRIPVGSKPTYQSSDSSVSKGWGTYANNSSIVWDDTLIL